MITWQQVIDKTAISGTAPALQGTLAEDVIAPDGVSTEISYTLDWFGGQMVRSASASGLNVGFSYSESSNSSTTSIVTGITALTTNGQISTTYGLLTSSALEGGGEEETGAETIVETTQNSDWSRNTTQLTSYSFFTETTNGTTTRTSQSQETFRTTTEVVLSESSSISTTWSQRPVTYITLSFLTNFERPTWRGSAYETTFFTGQTTALAYSSFYNEIPIKLVSGNVSTVASTVQPLSFYSLSGVGSALSQAQATIVSEGAAYNATTTQTTAGSVVSLNQSNPRITAGGTKIGTRTIFASTLQLQSSQFSHNALTTVTNSYATTSHFNIGSDSCQISFGSTHSQVTQAQNTYATEDVLELSGYEGLGTATNSFSLTELSQFQTLHTNSAVTAAQEIGIGLRAVSSGSAGASIQLAGRNNLFQQHQSSVFLAASKISADSNGASTWFADSYTVRDSNGGTTAGTYGAEGASVVQWMIANAAVGAATVLGGALKGNAVILPGIYATYAGNTSATTNITSAQEISWNSNANTTGYRRESYTTSGGGQAILETSRHPVTIVLDD
jgi:hypothetical protein